MVGVPKWWNLVDWAAGEDFSVHRRLALVTIRAWRHAGWAMWRGARRGQFSEALQRREFSGS